MTRACFKILSVLVLMIVILTTGPNLTGQVAASSSVLLASQAEFAGGDGSADKPFQISKLEHLNNVRNHLSKHFILLNDLSFSNNDHYENIDNKQAWTSGAGWTPIGVSTPFTGLFNGNRRSISGLWINRASPYQGLFAYIGESGEIRDGSLTGISVTAVDQDHVGGLAGYNYGTIINFSSTGTVKGFGNVGGLVGTNRYPARIINSTSSVAVSVARSNATKTCLNFGGLVGTNLDGGSIVNSKATGAVTVNSMTMVGSVGGLAGNSSSSQPTSSIISNSCATGEVSVFSGIGATTRYVGGLVGSATGNSIIENAYATGDVTIRGTSGVRSHVGGLIGYLRAESNTVASVSNSYALGAVTGATRVGGLIGFLEQATSTNSYSVGKVTGSSEVGGLIGGVLNAVVNQSYYDLHTALQSDTGKGMPLATSAMKSAHTFDSWDFSSTWDIIDTSTNISYPYLRQNPQTPAPGIAVRTYTVSYNANGASPGAAPVDSAHYEVESSVTVLAAPANMIRIGYGFTGWNSVLDGSGTQYSGGDILTMGQSNVTLYAQWTATGMLQVNTSGLGSVLLDGDEQPLSGDYSAIHPRGAIVRLTATPAEGYDFFYWEDVNSRRLASVEPVLESTLGLSLRLKAVFVKTPSPENEFVTVVFRDRTRRILKSEEIARYGAATPPPDPAMMGYAFLGWDDELSNIHSSIVVDAVYQRMSNTYEVTVSGGTLTTGDVAGAFRFDTRISVIANPAPAGHKFSHWEQDGRRIGVTPTLSVFTPMTSTTYTACYVSEELVILDEPFITLSDDVLKDTQKNTMTFVATRYIPADWSLVESGIVILQGHLPDGGLTLDTPDVQLGMVPNHSTHHFYMIKNDVQVGEAWQARGYLVCRNALGDLRTVYSETVSIVY